MGVLLWKLIDSGFWICSAEIEVKNGEEVMVKDDEKFAEYCADVIAKIILSQ